MNFSLRKYTTLLAVGAALVFTGSAKALHLDYSSVTNAFIVFNGAGTFNFTPAVNQFKITSAGAANNLGGEITGSFTIGAITTVAGVSSAPVSGSGSFIIHDGVGNDLVGAISWVDITQIGTSGSLNTFGNVNMTGITYSGANVDLLTLKALAVASNVLTFQFTPAKSLKTLKTTKASTSFSGSIDAVPDSGATVSLLGAALIVMGLVARRRLS